MDVKPYPKGEPTKETKALFKLGVLRKYPDQVERTDLVTDEGVDIVLRLKGVTPSVFKKIENELLLAAYAEGERYSEGAYKFAKFVVELDLNAKGRTAGVSSTREYTAAKNPDTDTMVFGTGVNLPEGVKSPFLLGKAEEIIAILESESPGPHLKRKTPFKVVQLVVSIRAGQSAHRRALLEQAKENLKEKMAEVAEAERRHRAQED